MGLPVPWPPSGARGEKRASQEAWPKGLGHWDTASVGRKRPLVAASASRDHPGPKSPSAAPKPIPPGVCGRGPRGGQLSGENDGPVSVTYGRHNHNALQGVERDFPDSLYHLGFSS
jgi:hypothetical protein